MNLSDDDSSEISDYDLNLEVVDIYDCQIPLDLPESFHEKFEIENLMWSISQESLSNIKERSIRFLSKNKNNQIFLFHLINNIMSAKPKLIELLFQVYDCICKYTQVNYVITSKYFDSYIKNKMFLYPQDSIMYYTIIDDFDGFREQEVKHNHIPFESYVEFVEDEKTLLNLAAKFGSINIFKYLMMSHSNLDISNKTFDFAIQGGNLEIIRYAMEYNDEPSLSLNKAVTFNNIELVNWLINEYQILPSIYVTLYNVTRMFFPLLSNMKNFNIHDKQSAIEVALANGHEELALYMLKYFGNKKMDFKSIISLIIDRNYDDFNKIFLDQLCITNKTVIPLIIDKLIVVDPPDLKEYLSHQIFKQNFDVLVNYSMKSLRGFKFFTENGFNLENFYFEKYGNNFYDHFDVSSKEIGEDKPELAEMFKIVLEKCGDETIILNKYIHKTLKSGNIYLLSYLKNLEKFKEALSKYDLDSFLVKYYSELSTEFVEMIIPMISRTNYNPHNSFIHFICRKSFSFEQTDTIFSLHFNKNILNNKSETPFYCLVSCKKYSIALQILQKYSSEINLNAKNNKGATPLLLAVNNFSDVYSKHSKLIYFMLKCGANPEIPTQKGTTAIDLVQYSSMKKKIYPIFYDFKYVY